jgi:tetratricopeptide (TPR) repeat protein
VRPRCKSLWRRRVFLAAGRASTNAPYRVVRVAEQLQQCLEAADEFQKDVGRRRAEPVFALLAERVDMARTRALSELKRYDEAVSVINDLVASLVADLPRGGRHSSLFRATELKATVLGRMGNIDEALTTFDSFIVILEGLERPASAIGKALLAKAEFAECNGRHGDAAQAYSSVIARFGSAKSGSARNQARRAAKALEILPVRTDSQIAHSDP